MLVNIKEIGDVEGMVDTGAKITGISLDSLSEDTKIRPPTRNYLTVDGNYITNVVGETDLTVTFQGRDVGLKNVAVFETMVYPLVLGIDWITKGNIIISGRQGGALVSVNNPIVTEGLPLNTPTATRFSLEGVMKKLEDMKAALNDPIVTEGPPVISTVPAVTTRFTVEDVKRKFEEMEATPEVDEELEEDETSEFAEVSVPLLGIELEAVFDGVPASTEGDAAEPTGPVKEKAEPIRVKKPDTEGAILGMFKPEKGTLIPDNSWGYVKGSAPGARNGTWIVSKTLSSKGPKCWIIPSCIVKAEEGKLWIPVINAGPGSCKRKDLLRKIEMEWVDELDTIPITPPAEDPPVFATLQPEWENEVIALEDLKVDPKLSPEEQTSVRNVLRRHSRLFRKAKGRTHLIEHRIETGDAAPVNCTPYRVSHKEREVVREHVKSMLDSDVIEPSNSPWSSPVVLAPKADGSLRFCIDYRRVNAVVTKDVYPLPVMDDILTYLSGARYFSSIDLEWGFWQIPVAEEHRHKTAFVTTDGLFQFKRLPFGLHTSPPNFQRLMDRVLVGLKWEQCLCYLDDILVFANTLEEHNQRLDRVLQAVGDAGMTLNPRKCLFALDKVIYLGYEIDWQGIRPSSKKVAAIKDFPRPDTVSKLRSFLGMASFYRKFVKNFASIAGPLHNMLKKNADIQRDWTEEHDKAVDTLKEVLCNPPVLVHDDGESPLELRTDASKVGLGAVLMVNRDGSLRPITYISKTLEPAEKKYHSNELECLALVWALDKLKHQIYGRPCLVHTDSSALTWLHQKKNLDKSGRLARWILQLQNHDISVKHLKGKDNSVADFLSRNPVESFNAIMTAGYTNRDLEIMQRADPEIRHLVMKMLGVEESSPKLREDFKLHRGVLYKQNTGRGRRFLLVVPSIMRKDLIKECHDTPLSGHHGRQKTLARLMSRFYWKNMHKSVNAYVASCPFCQLYKSRGGPPEGKLCPIPPPKRVFQIWGLDHLGPFKETQNGKVHMIVAIDYLSKWVEAEAVPSTAAGPVIKFLEKVFLRHGFPQRLISDRGPAFGSQEFAEFVQKWNIKHTIASAEHPQTNGLVEKINRALAETLAAFVNTAHTDWDAKMDQALFAINSAKQSTVQFSPYELVYGRSPLVPLDYKFPLAVEKEGPVVDYLEKIASWRRIARRLIVKRQKKTKAYEDLSRRENRTYQPGDLVIVARRRVHVGKTKKFVCRSIGPYQVAKRVSKTCYTVEDLPYNRKGRIYRRFNAHVSQIHPYKTRCEFDWKPEENENPEEEDECLGIDGASVVGRDFRADPTPSQGTNDPFEVTPPLEASSRSVENFQVDLGANEPPDLGVEDSPGETTGESGLPFNRVSRTGRTIRRSQLSDYDYY